MKKSVLIFLAVMMVFSCGKLKVETVETTVDYAWVPEGLTVQNPPEKIGLLDGKIYYMIQEADKMEISFNNMDGSPVRKLSFPVGNGPGELRLPMSLQIQDDTLYFYDRALNKIAIYNIEGEYIDEFPISSDIGTAGAITISGDALYFHGMFVNKLVKVHVESGLPVKTLEYDQPVTDMTKLAGTKLKRGNVHWDRETDTVYIGYYNEPYRIERFDPQLQLLDTFSRKLYEKYEPMAFSQVGASGNLLIASLKTDDNYLYAGYGGGQKISISNGQPKIESMRSDYYISVFDKESGEFVKEIRVKEIPELYGISNIVGVDDEHIVILFIDMGDTLKNVEMTGKDDSELLAQLNMKTCLVMINNPM